MKSRTLHSNYNDH